MEELPSEDRQEEPPEELPVKDLLEELPSKDPQQELLTDGLACGSYF